MMLVLICKIMISAPIVQPIQCLLIPFVKKEASNEPPPKRRKLSDINIEGIFMDKELCDADINMAQRLLRKSLPQQR